MADYTRGTGSSGTMMIRDLGGWVEFWLKAGSATFNHQLPWSFTANGAHSGWRTHDFVSGGNWQHLGSVYVTTRQTVTFHLGSTGTSGLGGPTDFSVFLERATVPPAPTLFFANTVSSSEVDVGFGSNGDGGSGILEWQVAYGTDPNGSQFLAGGANGQVRIGGLAAGTTWYFWARGRNALGWGGWSNRGAATTWRVPDAPGAPVLSQITQTSLRAVFTGNYEGGTPVVEWQIAYGRHPTVPEVYVGGYNLPINNLMPGELYYFWSRGRNSVGWSPLSAVSTARLIAGAYVKVGTVWKRAVPYVKVGTVWKVARPWAKIASIWKETG